MIEPDFWELERTPGYFGGHHDKATWLQEHRGDPYWMAHQLNNAAEPMDYSRFVEYWKMAREIKGYNPA